MRTDLQWYAAGETKAETGEAASKAFPVFPREKKEELIRLYNTGKPVVLLLFCGRPLILTDILPYCNAVLNVWYPGTMGAQAIKMLVTGEMSPSGHLSMTFPRSIGQIPIHHDRLSTCRPKGSRGTTNRFTNMYIDEENEPLFPFGFGMSYTDFELSEPEIQKDEVTVTVKNTGDCDGETVIQLYGRVRLAPIIRPNRTLVGWQRVALKKGESRRVTLKIRDYALRLLDCNNRPVELEGIADIYIGFDSDASIRVEYEL